MRGFQFPDSAHRFCRAYDEVRNFLRPATRRNQHVPAARRRAIHVRRVAARHCQVGGIRPGVAGRWA